jgi:archaellum component FlaF (FlaF/FlaG flagellin family)
LRDLLINFDKNKPVIPKIDEITVVGSGTVVGSNSTGELAIPLREKL